MPWTRTRLTASVLPVIYPQVSRAREIRHHYYTHRNRARVGTPVLSCSGFAHGQTLAAVNGDPAFACIPHFKQRLACSENPLATSVFSHAAGHARASMTMTLNTPLPRRLRNMKNLSLELGPLLTPPLLPHARVLSPLARETMRLPVLPRRRRALRTPVLQLFASTPPPREPSVPVLSDTPATPLLSDTPATPVLPDMGRPPLLERRSTLTISIPLVQLAEPHSPVRVEASEVRVHTLSLPPRPVSSGTLSLAAAAELLLEDSAEPVPVPMGTPPDYFRNKPVAQTLLLLFSDLKIHNYTHQEENRLDAYPDGPLEVRPCLYLYSEPTPEQAEEYSLVINVAQELPDLLEQLPNTQYVHCLWAHSSKVVDDLARLTLLMARALRQQNRVLVHCQCGVLRLATLIVAYLMYDLRVGVNEAYGLLKSAAPLILPNMGLIFQLMEWGERIGVSVPTPGTPAEFQRVAQASAE